MKLLLSAVVVVLISSQSFAAEKAVEGVHGMVEQAAVNEGAERPVQEAQTPEDFRARWTRATNKCLLTQGAVPTAELMGAVKDELAKR